MKKIKIILLFAMFFVPTKFVVAQEKGMYDTFFKLITLNDNVFFSDDYYEKGFFFSISMNVNTKGVIDSVMFSDEQNEDITKFIDFSKIRAGLKKNKTAFISHKNEVLVLLVVITRGDEHMLNFKNGNQIVGNWRKISNESKKIQDSRKKQVFLVPFLINYKGKRGKEQ